MSSQRRILFEFLLIVEACHSDSTSPIHLYLSSLGLSWHSNFDWSLRKSFLSQCASGSYGDGQSCGEN